GSYPKNGKRERRTFFSLSGLGPLHCQRSLGFFQTDLVCLGRTIITGSLHPRLILFQRLVSRQQKLQIR
ncbi:hypothetical protein H0H93_004990, partial [Arthromyces matolae]